jgi:hypothetical protein
MSKRNKRNKDYYKLHPIVWLEEIWYKPEDNSPGLGGQKQETSGREPMLGGDKAIPGLEFFRGDGSKTIYIPFGYGKQSKQATMVKLLRDVGYTVLELNRPETAIARALRRVGATSEPSIPPSIAHLIAVDEPWNEDTETEDE